MPGWVVHGLNTRRLLARYAFSASATARRVSRFRAGAAELEQFVMGDVGAQLAARAVHPLGQLVPVGIDQPVTVYARLVGQPGVAADDEPFDGVILAAGSSAAPRYEPVKS